MRCLNTASGATWVSIHQAAAWAWDIQQNAGVVIVCDGTPARHAASSACCGTIRPPA